MANNTTVVTAFNTTLAQSLKSTGTETEISLASTSGISYPAILKIGTGDNSEWISFTGISGNTITGATRGIKKNATTFTDADSTLKKNLAIGSAVILVEHSLSINNKLEKDEDGAVSSDLTFTGNIDFSGSEPTFRLPNLTTAERDALASPANGMKIYNTTLGEEQRYDAGSWVTVSSGGTFPNATTTVAGKAEVATEAETKAGTATGGTGASLIPTPATTASAVQDSSWNYGASSAGSDAYAITLTPAPTAYAAGQKFKFKADVANTGAATLDVNSLGATAIKKFNDQDLEDNDIEADSIIEVIYDGTNFQMLTPPATQMSTADSATLTDGSAADALHSHGGADTGNDTRTTVDGTGTQVISHGLGVVPKMILITATYNSDDMAYAIYSNGTYANSKNRCTNLYIDDVSGSGDRQGGESDTSIINLRDENAGGAALNSVATVTATTTSNFTLTWSSVDLDATFTWTVIA